FTKGLPSKNPSIENSIRCSTGMKPESNMLLISLSGYCTVRAPLLGGPHGVRCPRRVSARLPKEEPDRIGGPIAGGAMTKRFLLIFLAAASGVTVKSSFAQTSTAPKLTLK